jgi:hypothetical protein
MRIFSKRDVEYFQNVILKNLILIYYDGIFKLHDSQQPRSQGLS